MIELIYKASLAQIDGSMTAHVRFLKKYYAAGNFLVSGRKIPRDGGVILAVGENREQVEDALIGVQVTASALLLSSQRARLPR